MNGSRMKSSERMPMIPQICASAFSEVEKGGTWYQNV